MAVFSVYRCFSPVEKYLVGYKPEHFFFGMQVLVAFILGMLPLTVNVLYSSLSGSNTIWTVVTIAVVMEPNMGGAVRKGLLRALGAIIGGLIGILALVIARGITGGTFDLLSTKGTTLGPVAITCISIAGFGIAVHKQRFRSLDHFFFVMLYTVPVVLGQGIRDQKLDVQIALRRMTNVVLGVGIATLVSVVVFPIRARWLLQRDLGSMLVKVWVMSQVCQTPNPDGTFPGTTFSDSAMTYSDDGVEAALAPLHDCVHRQLGELAELNQLLLAADKEWHMFRMPRVFPTKKYRTILRATSTVLSLLQTLLFWLQSGQGSLRLVHVYRGDVREVAVQLSSSLVALSWLVCMPKALKKKRKVKGGVQEIMRKVEHLVDFKEHLGAGEAYTPQPQPGTEDGGEHTPSPSPSHAPSLDGSVQGKGSAGRQEGGWKHERSSSSSSHSVQQAASKGCCGGQQLEEGGHGKGPSLGLPPGSVHGQGGGSRGSRRSGSSSGVEFQEGRGGEAGHESRHGGTDELAADLEAQAPEMIEDDPFAELAQVQLASGGGVTPTAAQQDAAGQHSSLDQWAAHPRPLPPPTNGTAPPPDLEAGTWEPPMYPPPHTHGGEGRGLGRGAPYRRHKRLQTAAWTPPSWRHSRHSRMQRGAVRRREGGGAAERT